MEETLLHKHQPQVLFSLRAASSLAPAPHRHVLHGSPPFPGRATNLVLMKGAGLPEENSFAFQLHLETVDMESPPPSLTPLR